MTSLDKPTLTPIPSFTPTPPSYSSFIIINIPYQPITDILEATEDDGVSPPSKETASAPIIYGVAETATTPTPYSVSIEEPTPTPTPVPPIPTPTPTSADVEVTIDNAVEHQTMEGFGATHQTLVFGSVGDTLTASQRTRALDALFNQVKITTGQVPTVFEAPASSTLSTFFGNQANDNTDPLNLDWSGFFTGRGDTFKQKVVDPAGSAFDLYPDIKISIRWGAKWLGDIRSSDYNRFLDEAAEQALAGVTYWKNTYGSEPQYAMLFNEPLSGNKELGLDCCGLIRPVQEVVDIVKKAGARLRSEGFDTVKFVIPGEETESKSLSVAQAIQNDPAARQYVGAIAYHPYPYPYPYGSAYSYVPNILSASGAGNPDSGSISVRGGLRNLGAQYGIPVWMTEVSQAFFEGEGIPATDFRILRGRAIHIHDELLYANASAFFGMNSIWDTTTQAAHFGTDGSELLFANPDTIVLIEQPTDTVYITGMGYAIGHYARWINRGAIRIEATSSDPLVLVTAFRDDSQGRLVLVAINNASTSKTVEVNMNGLTVTGDLGGEQSTATAYWQPITSFAPATPTSFLLTLPPASVTTIAGPV